MRGKAKKVYPKDSEIRITPAYAGKRPRRTVQKGLLWDHPRLCGEKRRFASLWLLVKGSPPPMRGKGGRLD